MHTLVKIDPSIRDPDREPSRPHLVKQVRELHPDMKVIFISDYTEDAFRKRLEATATSIKRLATKVKR